eukprot:5406018-Pleurochrysis_carterae.AAC.2
MRGSNYKAAARQRTFSARGQPVKLGLPRRPPQIRFNVQHSSDCQALPQMACQPMAKREECEALG